jgi:hypothetical protein
MYVMQYIFLIRTGADHFGAVLYLIFFTGTIKSYEQRRKRPHQASHH